jgi:putative AlgH/UPF0301 family transcriptional regulator
LSRRKRGCLDGHFLIAMPSMNDERFERTVIFVCAHSEDGAMGFILNRPQPLSFEELVESLDLDSQNAATPARAARSASASALVIFRSSSAVRSTPVVASCCTPMTT